MSVTVVFSRSLIHKFGYTSTLLLVITCMHMLVDKKLVDIFHIGQVLALVCAIFIRRKPLK